MEKIDEYFQFLPGDIVIAKDDSSNERVIIIIVKSKTIIDGGSYDWNYLPKGQKILKHIWEYSANVLPTGLGTKNAWWNNSEIEKVLFLSPLHNIRKLRIALNNHNLTVKK